MGASWFLLLCWWVGWGVGVLGDARVDGDDEAVWPAGFCVIFADDSGERIGELADERGAVGRLREPHLGIEPERGEGLFGQRRAVDERARLPNEPGREREQPARRQPVGRPG